MVNRDVRSFVGGGVTGEIPWVMPSTSRVISHAVIAFQPRRRQEELSRSRAIVCCWENGIFR